MYLQFSWCSPPLSKTPPLSLKNIFIWVGGCCYNNFKASPVSSLFVSFCWSSVWILHCNHHSPMLGWQMWQMMSMWLSHLRTQVSHAHCILFSSVWYSSLSSFLCLIHLSNVDKDCHWCSVMIVAFWGSWWPCRMKMICIVFCTRHTDLCAPALLSAKNQSTISYLTIIRNLIIRELC